MKRRFLNIVGGSIAALIVISGVTFGLVFAQVEPRSERDGGGRFEGTWDVQVTVRDCQTLVIVRTFPAIATFMSGGTMLISEAGTEPKLKSPSQGVLSHGEGNSNRFKTKAFTFNASGAFTGWMIVSNEAKLNHSAHGFESVGVARVYTPNGSLIITGCSTVVATRFE